MMIEERLKELGITIPEPPKPVANFLPCRKTGNLVFVSGQGPIRDNLPVYQGKLGREVSIGEGYDAARLCAVNMLAQLRSVISDLERVSRIVSIRGFVASADDFYEQPKVINGCSDFLCEIFGERGSHARCALGVNVLPGNIPVEIEMVAEIKS